MASKAFSTNPTVASIVAPPTPGLVFPRIIPKAVVAKVTRTPTERHYRVHYRVTDLDRVPFDIAELRVTRST